VNSGLVKKILGEIHYVQVRIQDVKYGIMNIGIAAVKDAATPHAHPINPRLKR